MPPPNSGQPLETPDRSARGGRELDVPGLPGAIYGQLLTTSLVAALEVHEKVPSGDALATVAVTIAVLWVAHVYAHALSRGSGLSALPEVAAVEWAMLAAAFPTVAVLALGAAGVMSRGTTVTVAVSLGVASLFLLGLAVGVRLGRGTARSLGGALAGALFGLIVVGLKVLVH